jgi:lysyl-tRNA synthetase class 2
MSVRTGATSAAALAGLFLLVVAGGLARRQRRAWLIALTFLAIAGIAHLLKNLDVLESGLDLGMAWLLIASRREFDAPPTPGSLKRALGTLPSLAIAVWLFGWLTLLFHSDELLPRIGVGRSGLVAARGIVGLPLGVSLVGPTGRWIPGLLPLLGVFVVIASVVAMLRPVIEGVRDHPADVRRAREIVHHFGSDTLAYFALRSDKSHFISGDGLVAYRYIWNLGLVSGDPIGPKQDAVAAMQGFVRYARDRGWGVAVLAAGDGMSQTYEALGLRSFYIGDEAILDPRKFTLAGGSMKKVRQSCTRLERLGYSMEFLSDDQVTPDLQGALDLVGRSWRGRAPERGFTMALGRLPSSRDPDAMTVVGRDAEGRAVGYLHLVPCFGEAPGYSLDQMRRRPSTPNGLMEWMVAMTAVRLQMQGITRFSLNFSLLGGLFEKGVRLSPFQKLELVVARRLNPFFQIERLRRFNAKFAPRWLPRYIYYEAPFGFPRVALAYLEAEAFLRLPLIGAGSRWRRARWDREMSVSD